MGLLAGTANKLNIHKLQEDTTIQLTDIIVCADPITGINVKATIASLQLTVDDGENNTASNLGGGEGVFKQKSGVDLEYKSLVAGQGVTISSDASTITISATVKDNLTATVAPLVTDDNTGGYSIGHIIPLLCVQENSCILLFMVEDFLG